MPVHATQERRQFSDCILAADQTPYCIKILQSKPVEGDEDLNFGINPAFPVKYWIVQDASAGSDVVLNEDWVFEYLQKEQKEISETTSFNALCKKKKIQLC